MCKPVFNNNKRMFQKNYTQQKKKKEKKRVLNQWRFYEFRTAIFLFYFFLGNFSSTFDCKYMCGRSIQLWKMGLGLLAQKSKTRRKTWTNEDGPNQNGPQRGPSMRSSFREERWQLLQVLGRKYPTRIHPSKYDQGVFPPWRCVKARLWPRM